MAATKNSCHQVWTEGEDRPRCSGHGETMYCQSNGHWRCAVKMRDYDHRAASTPGTYRFNARHGIGIGAAKANLAERKRYRASVESDDQNTISQILAKYPDLRELVQ